MTNSFHHLTQDIQTRIRDLAYIMWDSAGRQQGMALEYWLAAEKEVLSVFQAAAEAMLPPGRAESSTPGSSTAAAAGDATVMPAPPAAVVETQMAADASDVPAAVGDASASEPAPPAKPAAHAPRATKATARRSSGRNKESS